MSLLLAERRPEWNCFCPLYSMLLALYMFLVYASTGALFNAMVEILVAAVVLLQWWVITTKAHQSIAQVDCQKAVFAKSDFCLVPVPYPYVSLARILNQR